MEALFVVVSVSVCASSVTLCDSPPGINTEPNPSGIVTRVALTLLFKCFYFFKLTVTQYPGSTSCHLLIFHLLHSSKSKTIHSNNYVLPLMKLCTAVKFGEMKTWQNKLELN